MLGQLIADVVPRADLVIATKAGHHPHRRGTHRRRSRGRAAAPAGRVAAQARHRLRRPLVRALRRRHRARSTRRCRRSTPRSPPARCATPACRTTAAGGSARAATWQRAVPGPGADRRQPGALLAARPRHRARGRAGLRRARRRDLPVVAARRRRADRQVPRRRAGRLAGRGAAAPASASCADGAPPASSRRSRRPPTGWPPRRSRWPWPGCATGPVSPPRARRAHPRSAHRRAGQSRRSTCRRRSARARRRVGSPDRLPRGRRLTSDIWWSEHATSSDIWWSEHRHRATSGGASIGIERHLVERAWDSSDN